ncbi:hypothetical protein [Viridibacillus arvi]|uniref:hypothetical protein n=1 Tax=Viridibacillus arvi TaxID=263475 RepID=UPI0034CF3C2B
MTSKLIIDDTKAIAENVNLKQKYRGITKKELIRILNEHADNINTMEQWREYSKIHSLPSLDIIKNRFSSFNNMKRELAIENRGIEYSKIELLDIALQHKSYLEKNLWAIYSDIHQLPTIGAYTKAFESFENVQKEVNILEKNRLFLVKMDYIEKVTEQFIDIVKLASKKWQCTLSKEEWEKHREKLGLPEFNEILLKFQSMKNVRKCVFFYIAKSNKVYFNVSKWDLYAKEHNLPLRNRFNSQFFESISLLEEYLNGSKMKIIKEELKKIVFENKDVFENATYSEWKDYSREHGLPCGDIYCNVFGSWNTAREELGFNIKQVKKYTKEEIVKIARENEEYFKSSSRWASFARENRLPSTIAYINHFGSFANAQKVIGIKPINRLRKRDFTEEELLEIGAANFKYMESRAIWNNNASKNNLPSYSTFYTHFGMKENIVKKIERYIANKKQTK